MKRLLVILAVVGLVNVLIFTGCAAPAPTPAPAPKPAPAPAYKWPDSWTTNGSFATSANFAMAAAMGVKMQEATGMKVRAIPGESSAVRARNVKEGIVDEAYFSDSTLNEAITGFASMATKDMGPLQIRAVWMAGVTGTGFVVRGDSPIKTIYDIKPGTRFVEQTGVPSFRQYEEALLAWLKIDVKDVTFIARSDFKSALWAVVDGQADFCIAPSISEPSYEAEGTPHGIRWLQLPVKDDPAGVERFKSVAPSISFGPIQDGPKSSLGVQSAVSFGIFGTLDTKNEELVYQVAKWRAENYNLYKDAHPMMKHETVDAMRRTMDSHFATYHNGLIRYFKEIGKWTAQDDAWQKEKVDLITKYQQAYKDALRMADEKGIAVDPSKKEWKDLWEGYKKQIGLPPFKARG